MKPILFNTNMVRAILEYRKTATRRTINPQPDEEHTYKFGFCQDGKFGFGTCEHGGNTFYVKPPCKVGDILYVRETWSRLVKADKDGFKTGRYVYKASDIYPFGEKYIVKFKWHPSIHMPRQAARIFLRVTDVRVERLQDISIPDIIKEGIRVFGCKECLSLNEDCNPQVSEAGYCGSEDLAEDSFADLWDSTIKKNQELYCWDADPWVWVIEFERTEKPEEREE